MRDPEPPCVDTLLESDLFEEGPLYLMCRGTSVRGVLDRTVVVGELDTSGALELRDAVAKSVVFRGRLDTSKHATGTLFAEGEERVVQSAKSPPGPLPLGKFGFDVLRTSATVVSRATLERQGNLVTGQVNAYGWLPRPPFERSAKGRLRGSELKLQVGTESWALRGGRGLLVGQVEAKNDLVLLLNQLAIAPSETASSPKSTSLELGEGREIATGVVKKRTRTCQISLSIPKLEGVPNADPINRLVAEQVVSLSLGPRAPDGPVPTPEEVSCPEGEGSAAEPLVIDGAYEAVDLGRGWANLSVHGYSRAGGTRAAVAHACLLLDLANGKVYRSDELLDDAQRETLTQWVERLLRISARNARLDLDDENYFANAAPVSAETSLCVTPGGLEVAFAAGEITKYMPTEGPRGLIPPRLVKRLVTGESPLGQIFRDAGIR